MGGISFSDMQFNQAWVLSKMRVEITELPKWRYRNSKDMG
jgi:hypothetical protein